MCKPGVEPSAELKPLSSKESVGYLDNLTPYISSEENQISHQLRQENSHEGNITPPIVYTPTHSRQGEDLRSTRPEKQVYTAYTKTDAATTELTHQNPSLLQQMLEVWDV